MTEERVYSVICVCGNCNYRGPVELTYGTRIPEDGALCPKCGCFTCHKEMVTDFHKWAAPLRLIYPDYYWDRDKHPCICHSQEINLAKPIPSLSSNEVIG